MKKLIIAILFISSFAYGQKIDTNKLSQDSIKFLDLNQITIKTLNDFEKQIKEIQEKQTLYLKGIFEANGFSIDKVKDLKFENGRFIFKTEK